MNGAPATAPSAGTPSAGNIQGALHRSGYMSGRRKKRKLQKLKSRLLVLKYWTSQARRGGAKRPYGRTGPKKLAPAK